MTLATNVETFAVDRIAKRYSMSLQERPLPTDADVAAVVSERVTALLEARLRDRDAQQTERSRRFVALGRSLAENEDELPIIAMLLDDYYQQMLHAPLPQPSEPSKAPADKGQKKPATGGAGRDRRRPGNKKDDSRFGSA
jgi:ATP-dependent RNA helicase DeaD